MTMIVDNPQRARQLRIFNQEFVPIMDALYNYAYHLCRNAEDANDLFQETSLKAFKAIDSYQVGTNAKAWAFQIMKNSFINHYRRRASRPTAVAYNDAWNPNVEGNPSANVNCADLRKEIIESGLGDEVTRAIERLSPKRREVIMLREVEEFSYAEIAKIIDEPIGTVRSRLNRARKDLIKDLAVYAKTQGFQSKR